MLYYFTEIAIDNNGLQINVPTSNPFPSFEAAVKAKQQLNDEDWNATWIMDKVQLFKVGCYIIIKCTMMNHKGPYNNEHQILSRTQFNRRGGMNWFKRIFPEQEWHPNMTFYRLYWVTANGHYKLLAEH